jgi:hypothetical protein
MTGDTAWEAWTVFCRTVQLATLLDEQTAHFTDTELRMLHAAEAAAWK